QRVHAPALYDARSAGIRRYPQEVPRGSRIQADGRPLHLGIRAVARGSVARRSRPGRGPHLPHVGNGQGLHDACARGRPFRLTRASLTLSHSVERWPIAGSFGISRGVKTEAVVVVAELADGKAHGRGECVPYLRYDETVESVTAQIEGLRPQIEAGLD